MEAALTCDQSSWAWSTDSEPIRLVAECGGALCTIVGIDGTYSRKVGSQLAIGPDGLFAGDLADGCLEAELASQFRLMGDNKQAVILRYGSGSPYMDFRLPCGAGVDILLDPVPDRAAIVNAIDQLDRRECAFVPMPTKAKAQLDGLLMLPRLKILILGAGAEVERMETLGKSFGALVETLKPGNRLGLGRVPDQVQLDRHTAVIVLFHDHEWEEALLPWALTSDAFYVGAIGGQRTRTNRLLMLERSGLRLDQIARLRAPVGLIPHSRDPNTLALSILAEIVESFEATVASTPCLSSNSDMRVTN